MEQKSFSQHVNGWRQMTQEDIKEEMERLSQQFKKVDRRTLVMRTGKKWLDSAKTRPTPRMLFSEFWHEGELCILFADTNLGKSILAVQIGNSISKGEAIEGFKLEAPAQPIIYFDFELSEKQFESRYSDNYTQHYDFSDNFYRAEMNPDADIREEYGGFEQQLHDAMDEAITETGARVLIIDNLTYLKSETERAQHALPLMKHLKTLKQRHNLSILALAHTPKRNASQPITKNDLQGSKMLMNFCDSAFAIGESYADKTFRYLKQVKQRYTESIYDEQHVIVCQTIKPDNFLRFELLEYSKEWEHLRKEEDNQREELEGKVKELLATQPSITVLQIARLLCTDDSKLNSFRIKVHRIVQRIKDL